MLKGHTLVGKTFRNIQANQIVVRVVSYNSTTDAINFHYMSIERYCKGIFSMKRSRFLETFEECMYVETTEKVKVEKMDTLQDNDSVNHPSHYGGDTTYEAIKVIEAWGLGFNLGNSVKYICRAGKKGDVISDLKKARWYLDREISNLQDQVKPDWDTEKEKSLSNIPTKPEMR